MTSPNPETTTHGTNDNIMAAGANEAIDSSSRAETTHTDGMDLADSPGLMQLVNEHGGATTDDEPTAAPHDGNASTTHSAGEPSDVEEQQPLTAANMGTTDRTEDAGVAQTEATPSTSMAPPPAPTLNLGSSLLRTRVAQVDPNMANIQAAQRALRERLLATKQAREAASRFGTSTAPASRASSTGASSHYPASTSSEVMIDKEEVEHQRLAADWKRHKAEYEKRKKQGTTTADDDLEHVRDQRDEERRVRQYKNYKQRMDAERRRGDALDDPTGLFVHDDDDDDDAPDYVRATDSRGAGYSSDDDIHRNVATDRGRIPSRKRKERDGGNNSDDIDDMIGAFLPEKRVKVSKDVAKKPGRSKGKKDTKPRAKSSKANQTKAGKPDNKKGSTHQLTNFNSLYTADVVRDAQRNQASKDQPAPSHSANTRQAAFTQLIATLPREQRKTNLIDQHYIKASMQDFLGHRTIEPVPDIGNGESGWQLQGMKSCLKHFQILGSAFMRRRETGIDAPFGGLDADGMGLGKTVMMLANIADALRYRKDKNEIVATLIVCPAALINQWNDEIHRHLNLQKLGRTRARPATVMVHTRKNKIQATNAESILAQYDFVLTTYDEVRRSFPEDKSPPEFQSAEEKKTWWTEFIERNKGLLHKVKWARVVLDEAQAIKNRKSRTSLACRWLQGEYRWALTGTPMPNRTDELYAYFKFLKVPNTGSYRVFCKNFVGKGDPDKRDRLHVFLNKIMLRRTHSDKLFNQPLVRLPQPSSEVHFLNFNAFERSVYEIVRRRMIERINHFSRDGELENNYRNVLVMLLRLRQLTGHILTIQKPMCDLLVLEDHERLKELAEEEADPSTLSVRRAQIARLRMVLAQQHNTTDEDQPMSERGPATNTDEELAPSVHAEEAQRAKGKQTGTRGTSTGKGHGLTYDFSRYLDTLRRGQKFEELRQRQKCALCEQNPQTPWVTSCFHVMCLDCLAVVQTESARLEKERVRCPECSDIFYNAHPLDEGAVDGEDDALTDDDFEVDLDETTTNGKKKKKRKAPREPDWIDMADDNLLPSSKTTAIKAQILNWLESDPEQKIIVYTQFLDMIRILARVCRTENWGFVQYHGGMAIEERDKVVDEFKSDPKTPILLATLKTGGVGLNLTMASRVIIVDPWWNKAVEEQAFCRVFRIGQVNHTYMTRFAVRNTVDEAMVNMQDRKEAEIDEVINDVNGRRNRRLPMHELLRLFGETHEDSQGRSFILVENIAETTHVDLDTDEEMFGDEE